MNEIFKIDGVKIGQVEDLKNMTGVTTIIFKDGAVAGVDVRGAAPGTRETALLEPENLVQKIHSIVLSGGSAFGLDSMGGVVSYLEENNIGLNTGVARVPIVTGAVLYDLAAGNPKVRPDFKMGYESAKIANDTEFLEGNYGAGAGATIGKVKGANFSMKGGIGIYTITLEELIVSAIVAVNAWGDVIHNGKVLAGTRSDDLTGFDPAMDIILRDKSIKGFSGRNTTIGAIITNAKLNKAQAKKIAQMGHDGFARAINPVHTMYDGDTLFAAGTGKVEFDINLVGSIGAKAVEEAIRSAIKSCKSLGGFVSLSDLDKNLSNTK